MWTIPFRISSSERASVAFDQKRERDALAVISLPPVSSQQTFHLNEATLKHWRATHRRWAPQRSMVQITIHKNVLWAGLVFNAIRCRYRWELATAAALNFKFEEDTGHQWDCSYVWWQAWWPWLRSAYIFPLSPKKPPKSETDQIAIGRFGMTYIWYSNGTFLIKCRADYCPPPHAII